jgi:hypothetical protein
MYGKIKRHFKKCMTTDTKNLDCITLLQRHTSFVTAKTYHKQEGHPRNKYKCFKTTDGVSNTKRPNVI